MGQTDRELLEKAALAAGLDPFSAWGRTFVMGDGSPPKAEWNPLADDGDALRLAVKLRIHIEFAEACVIPTTDTAVYRSENYGSDPNAATRRAIVRAAAAIRKGE